MSDIKRANEKLVELLFQAIDHGIDSIKKGGTLIPFLMHVSNGDKKIQRFVTKNIEDGYSKAKEAFHALEVQPDFAAIAYEGYVNMDNLKFDAVLVEGFDKHDQDTYVLAQRYKPRALFSKFKLIGNPAFLGSADKDQTAEIPKFYSYIMFNNKNVDLEIVAQKLTDSGMDVWKDKNHISTSWDDGPILFISHQQGEDVLEESKRIGKGSEFERTLNNCNSRFTISFDDLEDALDEINTLIEVQCTVQDLTNGILYNNWNHVLTKD